MRLSRCDLCHIDLDQVSVRRGGQLLLQEVSMHIHCGQLTVLIGQNGAGKTTLIRALLGEIPHGGSISHVDQAGRNLAHLTTGYVPQHLAFDPEMPLTVQDFLASSLARRPVWTGVSRKVKEEVRQALMDVQAGDLADRPLGRCSGGELQRVLLALALHPAPDLLVLDEPVSGVDRNGLKLFLDTVTHLKETRHIAILLVSHDLRLVREYADWVVLLDKSVLIQGKPQAVFSSQAFSDVFGAGEEQDAPSPDYLSLVSQAVPSSGLLFREDPPAKKEKKPGEGSASRIVRLSSHGRGTREPEASVTLPECESCGHDHGKSEASGDPESGCSGRDHGEAESPETSLAGDACPCHDHGETKNSGEVKH